LIIVTADHGASVTDGAAAPARRRGSAGESRRSEEVV